ncbi:hypothetical protein [Burkholderia cepacia]|uniref:hypothetical protein n=1 Tax=Burkholderia cepacia TaxID=292 RepID=UPI00158E8678|nr:hypothetical protein [Burkholderia cepacia]MCA8160599.1 hypothetical protein [Burkholderia cepacia]HEM7888511.1 hypothetical protein [Burkholderia cepacia]HEM8508700.1 hypothetical protein [Burkholderia cepacia]
MKNWKTVVSVLSGIAATIMISVFGATSAGTHEYSPELMAAWVQATGAIGAILASGWLVKWQFDKQRAMQVDEQREKVRTRGMHLVHIAEDAEVACSNLVSSFTSDEDLHDFLHQNYDPNRLEVIGVALREIPVLELPSSELVLPVVMLRAACERASIAAQQLLEISFVYIGQSAPQRVNTIEAKVIVEQLGYIKYSKGQIASYLSKI